MFDFPNSPTTGQIVTGGNGASYKWDGAKWTAGLGGSGVTSWNGRSGVVTLALSDVTGVGGAPLASPTFTGAPQAPTMTAGDNSTAIATTAFVHNAVVPPTLTLRSYLAGLTLSTAGSSATFSVAAGVADVGAGTALMTLASAMSKTTAAWVAGTGNGSLDTGAIANSTWYHVYLIGQTGGTTDILISLSATAPTVPGAYNYFRRIGAMKTNASGQWTFFHQLGDEFVWDVPVADVAALAPGTTGALYVLSVPTGVQVIAGMRASGSISSGTGQLLIHSPDTSAQASNTPAGNYTIQILTTGTGYPMSVEVRTNTSAQVRSVSNNATSALTVVTYGWRDRRGKDA